MNSLRRALGVFASSVASTERLVLHPTTFILQSYSIAAAANPNGSESFHNSSPPPLAQSANDPAVSERPRPTEIPFQPKVANSINLIGHVHIPVQFRTSLSGKTWAATVIRREGSPDSPHLWVPVIFEGDLAHIAACHLQEDDCIHIAGQLSAEYPYIDENLGQSNVQVMAQSLNFVQGYPRIKNISAASKQEKISSLSASAKNDSGALLSSWRDLLDDPKLWRDCRDSKLNGLVHPKHPDFKRKDGSVSLWLNRAPKWVLSKLEGLKFDVQIVKSKQASKGDESWRDVVDNPDKWWDNRVNKKNDRAPDFRHKETGEVLWLNNAPSWVLSKLSVATTLKAQTECDSLLTRVRQQLASCAPERRLE